MHCLDALHPLTAFRGGQVHCLDDLPPLTGFRGGQVHCLDGLPPLTRRNGIVTGDGRLEQLRLLLLKDPPLTWEPPPRQPEHEDEEWAQVRCIVGSQWSLIEEQPETGS